MGEDIGTLAVGCIDTGEAPLKASETATSGEYRSIASDTLVVTEYKKFVPE
jgi:hypothetical protein